MIYKRRAIRVLAGIVIGAVIFVLVSHYWPRGQALVSNADPTLRKSSAEFAADAAHRQYKADAPKGGEANAAIEVNYSIHRLSITNSSAEDWNNIEIWLNRKYVVFVPLIPAHAARVEVIDLQSFFDQNGFSFLVGGQTASVSSVDMLKDDKIYSLGQPRVSGQ